MRMWIITAGNAIKKYQPTIKTGIMECAMNALIRNTINEAMGMKLNSDVIIGMEVHVQLDTKTKLFCGCATQGSDEPNTRTCVTCLGMPGSKPRLNKKAVEYALKLALATNSKISKELVFSRKSYFYPD